MSYIITVYNVFKTAMKLKLKVTVAYYKAKPNLLTPSTRFSAKLSSPMGNRDCSYSTAKSIKFSLNTIL